MTVRRREFFVSALALGATAATPGQTRPSSNRYEVSTLPAVRPDGPMLFDPPIDTIVEFVGKADLSYDYHAILANFAQNNPSVNLMDPSSYLIVEKPRVAESRQTPPYRPEGGHLPPPPPPQLPPPPPPPCQCQCGAASGCGGGGGGGRSQMPNKQ